MSSKKGIKRGKRSNKNKKFKPGITLSIKGFDAEELFYKIYNVDNEELQEVEYIKKEIGWDCYVIRVSKDGDKYKLITLLYKYVWAGGMDYWEGDLYEIKSFKSIDDVREYIFLLE